MCGEESAHVFPKYTNPKVNAIVWVVFEPSNNDVAV